MFEVVARIGNNIGVFDTDDYSVEFHSVNEIIQYLKSGIVIKGVAYDGVHFMCQPLKVVVDMQNVIYDGIRVFNEFDINRVRKENASTYSFPISSGKRVKFRIENMNSCRQSKFGNESSVYVIHMSNGLYTNIPRNMLDFRCN